MKSKLNLVILAVALLFLVGWTIYGQKPSPAKVLWEYQVADLNNTSEAAGKLNELGSQGWELVSVTVVSLPDGQTHHFTVFLKRSR